MRAAAPSDGATQAGAGNGAPQASPPKAVTTAATFAGPGQTGSAALSKWARFGSMGGRPRKPKKPKPPQPRQEYAERHGVRDPHASLAAAVIEQAIADATTDPLPAGEKRGGMQRRRPMYAEHVAARLFLTSREREWVAARTPWCDLIGLDPEVLRQRALRVIRP